MASEARVAEQMFNSSHLGDLAAWFSRTFGGRAPAGPRGARARAPPPVAAGSAAPVPSPAVADARGALHAGQFEHTDAPATEAKTPDQKKDEQEKKNDQAAKANESLPADKKAEQDDLAKDYAKAYDPKQRMTEADYQALEKKGKDLKLDTGSAKPEDALKQRGIDDKAIDTLKNADKLDAQATATSSDPDLAGRTPAQLAETHVDANKNPLTPMSATQKQDTVAAQSALSEDIKQGADVRKAVTNESVLDMLAGGYVMKDRAGNPNGFGKSDQQTMGGDIGLKRSTEGQTSTEIAETLGLDYQ